MKIGKLAPGSHIPIVSPEELRRSDVSVLILFAWNFAEEIVRQEADLRSRGVKFLHPIPVPHAI